MVFTKIDREIWTTSDLELLPETTNRYETIDGELFVTRAPHWRHQAVCDALCSELRIWSQKSGLGSPISGPGIIFSDLDNVIPDLIWISNQRLNDCEDSKGHLTEAP
jgi:Uma2 family endonuclease